MSLVLGCLPSGQPRTGCCPCPGQDGSSRGDAAWAAPHSPWPEAVWHGDFRSCLPAVTGVGAQTVDVPLHFDPAERTVQKLPSFWECRRGNAPPPTSESGGAGRPARGSWARPAGSSLPGHARPGPAAVAGAGAHGPPARGCCCPGAVRRWVRGVAGSARLCWRPASGLGRGARRTSRVGALGPRAGVLDGSGLSGRPGFAVRALVLGGGGRPPAHGPVRARRGALGAFSLHFAFGRTLPGTDRP